MTTDPKVQKVYVPTGLNYKLLMKKLVPEATLPTKANPTDLGYDLYSTKDYIIPGHSRQLISTGIACNFPYRCGAILKDRSSVASKLGLFVHAGVIDNGYTGEILVLLYNSTSLPVEVKVNAKIAQMILVPLVEAATLEVTELPTTDRGAKGFGSSGV